MRTPPPCSTVTLNCPATLPAKVTTPAATEPTGDPTGAARSIPQCPEYVPSGAKGRTTAPGTGRSAGQAGGSSGNANTRASRDSISGPAPVVQPSGPGRHEEGPCRRSGRAGTHLDTAQQAEGDAPEIVGTEGLGDEGVGPAPAGALSRLLLSMSRQH